MQCFRESKADAFTGALFGARAHQEAGLKDVKGIEGQRCDCFFEFAFRAEIKSPRTSVCAHRRHQCELLRATCEREFREGFRIAEVDFAIGFPGTGFGICGAQGAECVVRGDRSQLAEVIEVDEFLDELGVRFGCLPARDGNDLRVGRIVEQLLQTEGANESRGAGDQCGSLRHDSRLSKVREKF